MGNNGKSNRLYFPGLQNHCRWWLQSWDQKMLAPWKITYDKLRQHIKKQRHSAVNKGPSSQSYGFSNSHIWMWDLDHKPLKNWCFLTVVLGKTLESPLDCKEIKLVNPKGNQPRVSTGRIDAEAEALILCHLMQRAISLEKTLMLGKTEGKMRRGWQRMRWFDSITDSMDMNWANSRKWVKDTEAWCTAVHGVAELDMT